MVLLAILHNLMLSAKEIRRSQWQILPFSHLARTHTLPGTGVNSGISDTGEGGDRDCLAVSHSKQGSLSLLADVPQSLGISTLFDGGWRKLFYG